MKILMDELEQSDSEKETNDPHKTFNENAKHYKNSEKAFPKKLQGVVYFILFFVTNPGGRMSKNYKRQKSA